MVPTRPMHMHISITDTQTTVHLVFCFSFFAGFRLVRSILSLKLHFFNNYNMFYQKKIKYVPKAKKLELCLYTCSDVHNLAIEQCSCTSYVSLPGSCWPLLVHHNLHGRVGNAPQLYGAANIGGYVH